MSHLSCYICQNEHILEMHGKLIEFLFGTYDAATPHTSHMQLHDACQYLVLRSIYN